MDMGWDRLLWEAGTGTSNKKNNHFWDIRTTKCFSVSLSRSMCHCEVLLDRVALFRYLSVVGLTHSGAVSLGIALTPIYILTRRAAIIEFLLRIGTSFASAHLKGRRQQIQPSCQSAICHFLP
jgi:hypothetical protein